MLAGQTLGRHRCRVYRKKRAKHKGKPGRPLGVRDKRKRKAKVKARHVHHRHGKPGRPRKVAC